MRLFLDEVNKTEKQNRYLMNQLAKTMGDISEKLANMGISPPEVAHLYSMIPPELLHGEIPKDPVQLQKYIEMFDSTIKVNEENNTKTIPKLKDKENVTNTNESNTTRATADSNKEQDSINLVNAETTIFPPISKPNDIKSPGGTAPETATTQGDQRVF